MNVNQHQKAILHLLLGLLLVLEIVLYLVLMEHGHSSIKLSVGYARQDLAVTLQILIQMVRLKRIVEREAIRLEAIKIVPLVPLAMNAVVKYRTGVAVNPLGPQSLLAQSGTTTTQPTVMVIVNPAPTVGNV